MASGNFDGASFDGSIGGFDVDVVANAIRNFSLRNWRKWTREELEEGELPQELRVEADQAVREATQASAELAAGNVEAPNALAVAMQARQAYEDAYKQAYQEAYVASIVAEHWKEDMRKARRRRIAAILLLH